MSAEASILLTEAREAAQLTQKKLAAMMGVNQTKISRIEGGDGSLDDMVAFLEAIGTEGASRTSEILRVEWTNLPRPSLRHPDLDVLIEIESGLSRVNNFLADGNVPLVLAGQADLLKRRLEHFGDYLLALNHDVAYVGEIGVGKTTAVCRQSGLVIDDTTAGDLKGMLLDTGGGRTTICDVRVEPGERFTLKVEPVADEEVYKLVAETCRGIQEKQKGEAGGGQAEFKPAEEVERALRNMAGLPRPARPRKSSDRVVRTERTHKTTDASTAPDPATVLANSLGDLEKFTAEFAARLGLWRRTRKVIEFDGIDPSVGRQWLKTTFTAINNGRHEDFSLPARIVVTVPFKLVSDDGLAVAVVDTRGVDGSAIRPDILAHLKDERAVTLLCSKWGSAPDPTAQELLKYAVETDADRLLLSRVAIVALARAGDAVSMRYDSGDPAEDTIAGYDIKINHIEDALQKIGISGVEAFAFDASVDAPSELTKFIESKIRAVRGEQATAAMSTIAAIDQMLENVEQAQALAVMETVAGELRRFAGRHAKLQETRRRPYDRLLSAVQTLHARTVWAASRRSGRFWNFDIFQYLGDGAAAEAKLRSAGVISGLTEVIQARLDNPEMSSAHGFLTEVLANAQKWEADFVNAVRHHAIAVYSEPLGRDQALWTACEAPYGSGGGYRGEVANAMSEWFADNIDLSKELDRRTRRAWKENIVERLTLVVGKVDPVGDNSEDDEP